MSDASEIVWAVYDSTGAPLTTATPAFVNYCDRSASARTPPSITNFGSGVYGFIPSTADATAGTVYLVDNGSGNLPRRVSGAISSASPPFFAWHLETAAGALWSTTAPTFGLYTSVGGARTPPSIVNPATGLYAFTPSNADATAGTVFRIDSAATCYPAYFSGSTEVGGGGTLTVLVTTPTATYIDIQFSGPLAALTMAAASPSNWTFASTTGTTIFATSVVLQSSDTVRVGITRPTGGATYVLTLPLSGLDTVGGGSYSGTPTISFTAVASALTVLSIVPLDGQKVLVQYTQAVRPLEAMDFHNYAFSPTLQILSIQELTPAEYVISTSIQTVGTSYGLTVTGVHDIYGNSI